MLYLLRSFTEDGSILKVGYASDYDYRLQQYEAHNPGIKEVSKKEGNIVDETVLHYYLHYLGYNVLKDEWYKDCQEVIDIFNSNLGAAEEAVWDNRDSIFGIDSFLRSPNGNMTLAYKYLKSKYGIKEEMKIDTQYLNIERKLKDLELKTRLDGLDETELTDTEKILKEFLSIPYFHNRMKYLYNLNLSTELANSVFDNIEDPSYSKYYWTISSSRAGTLNYQKGNLEAEYNSVSGKYSIIDLKETIFNMFEVGKKYTKNSIKSELQKIYDKNKMTKTAKANDLEEYFVLSDCMITNKETGKRDHAFEIISRKD